MDTATVEEKFHHAVELIKNLPKTGSFQPSNDLKLKFYSYYKQATEGPCDLPKPGFWDPISRAKWDAWSRLGNMSKESAMENYVDEFINIIKSAPFDESAHNYVHLMGPYIDLAPKEFKEKHSPVNGINSQTFSEDTPIPVCKKDDIIENHNPLKPIKDANKDFSNDSKKEALSMNGHSLNGTTESDSDEFSDTYDNANGGSDDFVDYPEYVDTTHKSPLSYKSTNIVRTRGGGEQRHVAADGSSPIPGSSGNRGNRFNERGRTNRDFHLPHSPSHNPFGSASGGRRNNDGRMEPSSDINEQLAFAVIRLQHTMEQVVSRLDSLEALLQAKNSNSCVSTVKSSFSSVFGIPPRAAVIILGWPFIVHWLIYVIQKRRRR